jgi:dihydroorotate dehydrogenase
MVLGSTREKFCTIAKDAKEFKIDYIGLQNSVLTREEFAQRAQFIHANFNNEQNCSLIQKIISHENSL